MKKTRFVLLSGLLPLLCTVPSWARTSEPARPPIDFKLSAEQVATQCSEAQKSADVELAKVIALPAQSRTFANTVLAIEQLQTRLTQQVSAPIFLKDVATDKKVREAGLACGDAISTYAIRLAARPDLYQAYQAISKRGEKLEGADAKLLELYLINAKQAGAALSPDKRAEVTRLKEQLSKLQDEFSAELGNNTDSIEVTRAELEGLSDDYIARLKRLEGGNYVVTVKAADYTPFMENARSSAARRRLEVKYQSRGGQANVERLEKAIALRDQIARLLGYPNHSAYTLADQMAGTPQRVETFLGDLSTRLQSKTRQELQVLLALKQKDEPGATTIEGWDWRYYANQLKKSGYAVDGEAVRAYFPVDRVIRSVFDIYQKLLAVQFEEVSQADAWAPDVRLFVVRDAKDNAPISHFYVDLYPREGKFNHFAAFDLGVGRKNSDGSYFKPFAAMVGNWPRGSADKPALLSHNEVETFFHEFGHIMHQTLTQGQYASLSGTNVRRDFVEAPSQMLENWAWEPAILKQISGHYQTGAPLPDALIGKLIAAKNVNQAIFTSRQLLFATVDYRYHSSGPKVDTTALWGNYSKSISQIPIVPSTVPQASFGHLMGGYDSRYYGYLWSKVYAQDMFTRFEKGGLTSPVVGATYRQWILQPGGTQEPGVLIRNFLGREPNPEAFYKDLGL